MVLSLSTAIARAVMGHVRERQWGLDSEDEPDLPEQMMAINLQYAEYCTSKTGRN